MEIKGGLFLLLRLGTAVLLGTSYVPDEYFQSVEVAYRYVHGQGVVSWEWEDEYRIRSFLSLLPYVVLFKFMRLLGVQSQWCYAVGPRIMQGIAVAVSDWCLYHLSSLGGHNQLREGFRADSSWWTLFLHCSNWYWLYSATRTLANTTETLTYIIVLYLWYSAKAEEERRGRSAFTWFTWLALLLMCFQSYSRPTSVLLFAPIVAARFVDLLGRRGELLRLVMSCTIIGTISVAVGIFADSSFYEKSWTISPLNFLYFNIYRNVSSLFGTQSFHWNFTVGLPTILGLSFPLLGCSFWLLKKEGSLIRTQKILSQAIIAIIVFPLGLHCFSAHQELRFLAPVLPAAHIVLGSSIAVWTMKAGKEKYKSRRHLALRVIGSIAVIHSLGALYLMTRHQSGPEMAVRELVQMATASGKSRFSVMILAPCYTFPGFSFMHTPPSVEIQLEPLRCSPFEEKESSQSSLFAASPVAYYRSAKAGADAVLTFDAYSEKEESNTDTLGQALLRDGYHLEKSFHHADVRYDFDADLAPKRAQLYRRSS